MKKSLEKMTLAVLIGNRGFFPSYLVGDARSEAQRIFKEMNINVVMLIEEQTNYGGIETHQDAKIAGELLKNIKMKLMVLWFYCLILVMKKLFRRLFVIQV
ncbi:hypothetical protein ACUHGC_04320 [Testudinibacter sp. P27/CKL/0425]